jgi:adenylylsulfate kinase-like enzyme
MNSNEKEMKLQGELKVLKDITTKTGKIKNVAGLDLKIDFPVNPHVHLKWSTNKEVDSMFQELLNNIKHF